MLGRWTVSFNPRPAGGGQNLPFCWFFQNNFKTVADINTKFCVPYLTSIWHRMTRFGRNRLNVKKFSKNRVLNKPHIQTSIYVKCLALQNNYLEISKFWVLTPKILKTRYFWKTFMKSKIFRILKKKRNICHRTLCLLALCQISRNSINIWCPDRPKSFKNYAC